MLANQLKVTNRYGDSIEFGRHFRLIEGLNLSNLSASVNYSESTADGARYQSTRLEIREFDISFFIDRNHREDWWLEERRSELFKVFNPKKNPMRLDFTTKAGKSYYLVANLELTPLLAQGFEHSNQKWQKGLLQFTSHDPYIYEAEIQSVDIATWIGSFSFPLEIPEEGIEMGYRSQSLVVNVINGGQDRTGMLIRFRALATVVNPSLINVNTYEEFKLNFTMKGGDVIEILTYRGSRSITLIRNNVETNIFNTLELRSKFPKLEVGDNLYRYDSEEGLDNLEVQIQFTPRLLGV